MQSHASTSFARLCRGVQFDYRRGDETQQHLRQIVSRCKICHEKVQWISMWTWEDTHQGGCQANSGNLSFTKTNKILFLEQVRFGCRSLLTSYQVKWDMSKWRKHSLGQRVDGFGSSEHVNQWMMSFVCLHKIHNETHMSYRNAIHVIQIGRAHV